MRPPPPPPSPPPHRTAASLSTSSFSRSPRSPWSPADADAAPPTFMAGKRPMISDSDARVLHAHAPPPASTRPRAPIRDHPLATRGPAARTRGAPRGPPAVWRRPASCGHAANRKITKNSKKHPPPPPPARAQLRAFSRLNARPRSRPRMTRACRPRRRTAASAIASADSRAATAASRACVPGFAACVPLTAPAATPPGASCGGADATPYAGRDTHS